MEELLHTVDKETAITIILYVLSIVEDCKKEQIENFVNSIV